MIFWMKNEKKKTTVRSLIHEQQKETRKKRFVLFLSICAAVALLLLTVYLYFFFTIKTVACKFEHSSCTQEQIDSVLFLKNRSSFQKIDYTDSYYTTTITKKFPQTVEIHFTNPEVLMYLYKQENNPQVFAITKNGYLITTEGTDGQVILTDLRLLSLQDHTKIDSNLFSTIQTLHTTIEEEKPKELEKVLVKDQETVEWHYSSKCRILTTADRIKEQMSSLQQLRESPTIELNNLEIDLRFDHPIITKKVE